MARPSKHVKIKCTCGNIMTPAGKLRRDDEAEVERAFALEVLEGDKESGRAPRIEIVGAQSAST